MYLEFVMKSSGDGVRAVGHWFGSPRFSPCLSCFKTVSPRKPLFRAV